MPAAVGSIDERLKEWATPRQAEYIDAINQHGSIAAAAEVLGVDQSSIVRCMQRVRAAAGARGYAPACDNLPGPVPEGFFVKRRSARFDKEGNPAGGWLISEPDKERQAELIRAAFDAMAEELPRVAPTPAPIGTSEALCNLYTMTDCHMGMLAWRKEGGADWDLKIAERTLTGCFEAMVDQAPPARVGIVNQLGDFLHADGLAPVTPTSGHVLDADSRFEAVVQATVRVLRRLVGAALARHEKVIVLMAEGNHDMASSVWLRVMFKALYEREPRVEVVESALPYYAIRHGQTMLGFHHGHLKKNNDLPGVFAAQFARMWGDTTKRYVHVGHWHHELVREHYGVKVIQHPTLAARDAYASRHGYLSERQATAYTYHAEHGQVATVTVTPEMLG